MPTRTLIHRYSRAPQVTMRPAAPAEASGG
jgi:hypothetical protein